VASSQSSPKGTMSIGEGYSILLVMDHEGMGRHIL
jgi:hypothetical protein